MMSKIWSARNQCHFKHQQSLPHVIAADAVDFVLEFNKASPCKKVLRQQSLSMGSEPTHKGFNIIQVDAECYANERLRWAMLSNTNRMKSC